jgi:short-subunit dehydrogenase
VPGSAAYSATKSFIQNFGEGLQVELKPYGIDVLIAAPGPVVTGFGSRADMKYRFGEKASTVSRSIVANIGKSMTLRPGPIAKILEFALASAFFRKIRSFILGTITRDMTQHQVKR